MFADRTVSNDRLIVAAWPEGEESTYAADAMMHLIHEENPDSFASDWADLNCVGVIKSRRALYEQASSSHSLVLAFHFLPFPGFGHIERVGEGWRWAPLREE